MPSAKIDSDTAVISRRYSRDRKGASTRHRPASATGFSMSICVLTPLMVADRPWPRPPNFALALSLRVGEAGRASFLEGFDALAIVGAPQQRRLSGVFALECAFEFGQR